MKYFTSFLVLVFILWLILIFLYNRDTTVSTLKERSPKWTSVRAKFISKFPTCEACGTDDDLDVHHIKPFNTHPQLELDESNLITLCRHHHFTIGHWRNWSIVNPNVRTDCKELRKIYDRR
jgi:hypothetical protein